MKVTGWTYWENPNYIDIAKENTKIRANAVKDIEPIPNAKERHKYTDEQLDELLKIRRDKFGKALDNEEIHKMDAIQKEVINAVVNNLRENGYHFSGDTHQSYEFGVPIIDDKYILCVSMRTWGGIMAEAFPNEIDNSNGLGYVMWSWYNSKTQDGKTKLPNMIK